MKIATKSLTRRLEELEGNIIDSEYETYAICEDGSTWLFPTFSVMDWIAEHGRQTSDGRKIVDMVMPERWAEWDGISRSLVEYERQLCTGEIDIQKEIEELNEMRNKK